MGLDDLPEGFNPMGFMNGDRAVYDWDFEQREKDSAREMPENRYSIYYDMGNPRFIVRPKPR